MFTTIFSGEEYLRQRLGKFTNTITKLHVQSYWRAAEVFKIKPLTDQEVFYDKFF